MTTTQSNLVQSKYIESTQTAQYTSSNAKTVIDKCTITNVTTSNAIINVNIIPNAGTAATNNKIISNQLIEPNETYLCPELIGLVMSSGDFVSMISSASNALVLNMSGRLIT